MKRSLALALPCLLSLVFTNAHAHDCDPGPDHEVSIDFDDTPTCVSVSDPFSYGTAELRIENDCLDPFEIEATTCDACGINLVIASGDWDGFVLEDRDIEDGLTDGSVGEQVLTWTLGAQSGTIETTVTYRDKSDACAHQGCAIGARSTPPWLLLVLVGLLSWRRRPGR